MELWAWVLACGAVGLGARLLGLLLMSSARLLGLDDRLLGFGVGRLEVEVGRDLGCRLFVLLWLQWLQWLQVSAGHRGALGCRLSVLWWLRWLQWLKAAAGHRGSMGRRQAPRVDTRAFPEVWWTFKTFISITYFLANQSFI